jgi:hypothetical protein
MRASKYRAVAVYSDSPVLKKGVRGDFKTFQFWLTPRSAKMGRFGADSSVYNKIGGGKAQC